MGRGKGMEDADHGASPTTLEVHDKKQWSTAAQKSMHCRVISLLIFYGHTEVWPPIHKWEECSSLSMPGKLVPSSLSKCTLNHFQKRQLINQVGIMRKLHMNILRAILFTTSMVFVGRMDAWLEEGWELRNSNRPTKQKVIFEIELPVKKFWILIMILWAHFICCLKLACCM